MISTTAAFYSILSIDLPGANGLAAGVLLEDPSSDRLYLRLRRDWAALVEDGTLAEDDAEVLETLEHDLNAKSSELGAARFLALLEDSLSNAIRIADREPCLLAGSSGWERTLASLYQQHVAPRILPFRTHLPVYSLRAAAGRFLENQQVVEEGWEEVPGDLRLTEDLFVAHIQGRSMEPRIPDGSRCVFRSNVTGSRNGRLVLVENLREGSNHR
ncbi:MAG: S24 family peptidase, partial [Bryobacteraceae bacterium]